MRSRRPLLSMNSIAVEVDDDVLSIRNRAFDLRLQALDVREVDLAAEADRRRARLRARIPSGELGSVMLEGPSRQDAESYHVPADVDSRLKSAVEPPHDLRPASSIAGRSGRLELPESRTSTRKPPSSLSRHVDLDVAGLAVAVGVLDRVRARLADREEERLLQRLLRPLVRRASSASKRGARAARRPAPGTDGGSARRDAPRAARPSPRRHRRARRRRRAWP